MLRRYRLQFPNHNVWAGHRLRSETPSPDAVAQGCAAGGITAVARSTTGSSASDLYH